MGCHFLLQCIKVKSQSEVAQSCPILGDPMNCSLSGSSVHGILQARVLEWGAIAFSEVHSKNISGIFSLGSNYVLSVKYVKLDILNLLPGHKTNLTVGT